MELGLLFERAQFYYEAGGYVMPWLVLATLVLWFGLGYRAAVLRRGGNISVRVVLRREIEGRGGKARGIIEQAARDGLAVARSGGAHLRRRLDDALADHFNEPVRDRHSAPADAALAARIFLRLLPELDRVGAHHFGDAQDLCAHSAEKISDLGL